MPLTTQTSGRTVAADRFVIAILTLLSRYSESDTVAVGMVHHQELAAGPLLEARAFDLAATTTIGDLSARLVAEPQPQPPGDRSADPAATASTLDRNPTLQVAIACPTILFEQPTSLEQAIDDITDTAVRCDLTFIAAHTGNTATLICDYDADLFDSTTADRLLSQWETLATSITGDRSQTLLSLNMMSEQEHGLVMQWSHGTSVHRDARSVHGLIADQAASTPTKPAVTFQDSELTYGELDDIANGLAELLLNRGLGPHKRIVTCVRRSLRVPAVYLAILKSGNAFVPIDPDSPHYRVAAILTDSHPSAVICDSVDTARDFSDYPGVTVLVLDDIWPAICEATAFKPDDVPTTQLAYIMYTSGSTGTPKGVMVEHASICNRLQSNEIELCEHDRVMQKTPLTFDVSLWEIFAPLLHGACLVVAEPDGHRDSRYILTEIDRRAVTTVHFVPSMLRQFLKDVQQGAVTSLRRVTCSGEALPLDLVDQFHQKFPELPLYNFYGPTEASIEVTSWRCQKNSSTRTIPIGRPIANVATYILDEQRQLAPVGVTGDLFLGGAAPARGYTDPKLDENRFVYSSWDPTERLYASGDRARWLSNGAIEYLGRTDRQVKIRGVRIELAEVESCLVSLSDIAEAAVITESFTSTGPDMVAYVVAHASGDSGTEGPLRKRLATRLPDYMIPAHFISVDSLPHNSAGKIDYTRLASLRSKQPKDALAQTLTSASTRTLTETVRATWQTVLNREIVGGDDNFFDLGGNSLLVAEVHRLLEQDFPGLISRTDLFRHPTIDSLVSHLSGHARQPDSHAAPTIGAGTGSAKIAIIGMACETPGARDVDDFWDVIRGQRATMQEFSDAELLEAGIDPALLSDPHYVRRGAVLHDPSLFDAELFAMSPRDAQTTDPQHRLLLEMAHLALEHAGYGSHRHRPTCGVYVGATPSEYFQRCLASDFHELDPVEHYRVKIGNETDFLPTLLAYKLDLRGPALAVQTACSTSLVAAHLAAESLARGDCDIALAGGVTIRVPDKTGYRYQDGMVQSPDGYCRAFDDAAAGTVFGSGAGIVVLKRLHDAINDGDRIYAVIHGTAVNNDGAAKIGYTAPSVDGQAEVITKAHRQAGVQAHQIGYVEAHGTGTTLGDPIEIEALTEAFNANGKPGDDCVVGSVKANVGHLDAAAGVIALIKTALAVDNGIRPGQCNLTRPSKASLCPHSHECVLRGKGALIRRRSEEPFRFRSVVG